MSQFIKVTAMPCNNQGIVPKTAVSAQFSINVSLIAAIRNQEVYLNTPSGGLVLGGHAYTNFRLAPGVSI